MSLRWFRSVSPHLPHHLRSLLTVQWSRNPHSPGHGSQPHGDDVPLIHSPWREEGRQGGSGRGGGRERVGGEGEGGWGGKVGMGGEGGEARRG